MQAAMTSKQRSGPCIYTTPAGLCSGAFSLHPKREFLSFVPERPDGILLLRQRLCHHSQPMLGLLRLFLTNEDLVLEILPGPRGIRLHVIRSDARGRPDELVDKGSYDGIQLYRSAKFNYFLPKFCGPFLQ